MLELMKKGFYLKKINSKNNFLLLNIICGRKYYFHVNPYLVVKYINWVCKKSIIINTNNLTQIIKECIKE